ncbi:MAG: acetyl-CoA hydrolase/transferase family protein [Vulcanimicrobiota bacterium]
MSWKDRAVTPTQAVAQVKSHDKIFLHGAAAAPLTLEAALCQRHELQGVNLYHIHVEGRAPFAEPEHKGRFASYSFFTGPNLRLAVSEGRADFIPVFLSDIPLLFRSGRVALDVALVSLSMPDRHGFCSLGPSVEAALEAVRTARLVIAEINPRMPRTHGDSFVHLDQIDHFCLVDRALPTHEPPPVGPVEQAIGDQIAAMIEDGNTLQLGIGAIPAAVVSRLGDKNDLGVHTEMFTDGVVELMTSGVINNSRKTTHAGHTVTSFVSGSQKLFDFINDNPAVEFYGCDYTNNVGLIAEHDHMVAVNSALEVDLSGQVCADSIGHSIYSGIGGQMDFIRGAALSRGGKPIIALPSTARGGSLSRIVSTLKPGAGVVTTRGHVHWVVTEYGAVNLHGLSLRQRAEALISIAHPDFRPQLQREFREQRHFV